jgi:toxin FitB
VSYLLDTNILSETRKKRPEPRVQAWLERQPMYAMYISVITLGELQQGAWRAPTVAMQHNLLQWVERRREQFLDRVLPLDEAVMQRWAEITAKAMRQGFTPPLFDSLIAATALEHQLVLVTRNTADFQALGVKTINPWHNQP